MLLNRPAALNALNSDMLNIITPQLQVWRDSNCSLIIFNSSSPKAFCAGGDVISLFKSPDPLFFKLEYQLNHFIGTTKKPILSILSGLVMGGGVGLSVHGPFRIATESTIFAMPETKIGFFPDVGGSFFLSRLDGNLGIFLGLVGYRLKGIDVLMAGIATHFVPQARLPQLIARLSEIQSDNFEIISSAIEEYVGDPVTVQEWENWTLGGGNREIIERYLKHNLDVSNSTQSKK